MLFVFYAYSGVHVLTVYMNCMPGVLLGTAYHLRTPDFTFDFFGGCRVVHILSFLCCPIITICVVYHYPQTRH
jgi:hypothetical protein